MQIELSKGGAMLYIRASRGPVAGTIEYRSNVYLDVDHDGYVIGMEVVDPEDFFRGLEQRGEHFHIPERIDAPEERPSADMTERITLNEAAEIAGLSAVTLRQAATRGTLVAERIGPERRGIWYTTRADLEDYLDNRPAWFQSETPATAHRSIGGKLQS